MSLENVSAWFEARGVPPLLAGAVLGVVFLLVFKTLVRPRADRGVPLQLERRSRRELLRVPTEKLSLPPEISGEVRDLLRAGQKLEAVQLVRKATGLGLKEAKDVVDGVDSSSVAGG